MADIATKTRVIDDIFQDVNIRAYLREYVFVLDGMERSTGLVTPREQAADILVTALFQHMNNPFAVIVAPISRTIILEIMREGGKDWSDRYLERVIPAIKTIENGSTVRDYFATYKDVNRRLE